MGKKRLSSIDTVMLKVEDPVSPNMGTGVMLLGAPVEFDRLVAIVQYKLLRFRRFQRRIVESRRPCGPHYWLDDPSFDLNYHLRRATLPPPGDRAALQELVSLLAGTPLDLNRPLWQLHLVEDYEDGCAVIVRIHHSVADGVALMHVLLSLGETDPDAPWPALDAKRPPRPKRRSLPGRFLAGGRRASKLARRGLRTVSRAEGREELAQVGLGVVRTASNILLSAPDSDTALRGQASEPKRVAWTDPLPLPDVKYIGRQLGGTVNDILLTALTGSLRHYLQDQGDGVEESFIRALVPISLRPEGTEDELGNQIGIVLLPLPIHVEGPVERLRTLKKEMDGLKGSLDAPVIYTALHTVGRLPTPVLTSAVDYLCSKATAEVTNVKGPQEQLYIAGAPLDGFMFWIPRFGGIGLGVSIQSYNGKVWLGAVSDESIVSDPGAIVSAFCTEFETLLRLAHEADAGQAQHMAEQIDEASASVGDLLAEKQGTGVAPRRYIPTGQPLMLCGENGTRVAGRRAKH